MSNTSYLSRLGLGKPTPRVTRQTLFSTSTSPQTGIRATGPTGAWRPRVKWTRDYPISADEARDPDLSQDAFCTVFVCIVAAFITQ